MPMEFQFHQRAVQGHASNFLKHSITRSSSGNVFGPSLDRSTMPTLSPVPLPLSLITFTAVSLLQHCSSPGPRSLCDDGDEDAVTGVRTASYLKTVDADPSSPATSGHDPTWIRPIGPSRQQLLHSLQRLVLLESAMPSLCSATQSAIYSCQCGLGRHAFIVHF
jgi:hypothetical protein